MPLSHYHFRQISALSLALIVSAIFFNAAPAHALTEAQQDAAIAGLQSAVSALQSKVNSQQTTINSQQTAINTLSAKLQYVTTTGHDMTLTGNLHVISGAGATNASVNGLGNIIIGYNELQSGSGAVNKRTGSHCLILGTQNNYTSYGGIVAGQGNTIGGSYAGITGGFSNTAVGAYSSIAGGYGNTANGSYANIAGGRINLASGSWSSVSGGYGNTASATYAAVGGGNGYVAGAQYAFLPATASTTTLQGFQTQINNVSKVTSLFTISTDATRSDHKANTELTLKGMNLHIINGLGATNGEPNYPTDVVDPVVNGLGNLIIGYNLGRDQFGTDIRTGSHNLVIGDQNNYSSIGGIVCGNGGSIGAPFASITSGHNNIASGLYSSVSGGSTNSATAESTSVSGGEQNTSSFRGAAVSGGASINEQQEEGWSAGTLHSP